MSFNCLAHVEYVVMGSVIQEVKTANIAREVGGRLIRLFMFTLQKTVLWTTFEHESVRSLILRNLFSVGHAKLWVSFKHTCPHCDNGVYFQ